MESRHTPVIVEFDQNTELEDDLHIARGCVQCDVAVRLGADALMLTFAPIQGARAALENLELVERRGRAETIFWRFSSDTRERDGAGGTGCEVGELMICDKPLSLLPRFLVSQRCCQLLPSAIQAHTRSRNNERSNQTAAQICMGHCHTRQHLRVPL